MSGAAIRMFGLQLRLALQRSGWPLLLAAALCAVGTCGWLWLLPSLRAGGAMQHTALLRAEAALQATAGPQAAPKRSVNEANLEAFRQMLGERHYAEQQVKTFFAIAAASGLTLAQAEYKSSYDKNSDTWAYRILLPVNGPYGAIHRFCQQVLLAIPFASLDEISFKREAIAERALDARLRFTLYLADAPAGAMERLQ